MLLSKIENRDISLQAVTSVIRSSEVRTVPKLVFFMVEV
jgi:hypothetical protein